MACCLMAPSHYPNQCWFVIKIFWLSFHSNVYLNTQDNNPQVVFRPGDNELKSQKGRIYYSWNGVSLSLSTNRTWCKIQGSTPTEKKCCSLAIINRVHVRGKANDCPESESGAWNIVASRMASLRGGSVRQQSQYGMEFKSHRQIKKYHNRATVNWVDVYGSGNDGDVYGSGDDCLEYESGTCNIIKSWKCFPHHWPVVRRIHQSPVCSPHKGPVMWSLDICWCWPEQASAWGGQG